MDRIKIISNRIKDLREFSDYSVEDFAEKLGISTSEYVDLEKGIKDIPIGLLYNIAALLEIDASIILFGEDSKKEIATVIYNGKGPKIERYEGYSFVPLASDFYNRDFEPMIVTISEGIDPELVRHKGQEFNYCIQGSMRVIVGEKEFYLRKGDSIYFNAELSHAQVAMSPTTKFISVIPKG